MKGRISDGTEKRYQNRKIPLSPSERSASFAIASIRACS